MVAYLTPLWHGVALARGHRPGHRRPASWRVINVAYLAAFVVVGLLASYRTFGRKLAE